MVLDFRVECVLDMDRESYWKVKATKGYFDFLVSDNALYKMEALAEGTCADGSVFLKCAYIPRTVEIPDVLRAVLGDAVLEVVDEQTWNFEKEEYKLDFVVTPTFMNEQIKTTGCVRLLPDKDPTKTIHIVEGRAEVNVYFVWSYMEEALSFNMKKFYEKYPVHVANFKQHMIDIVGDHHQTCAELVDAYLNHPSTVKLGIYYEQTSSISRRERSAHNIPVPNVSLPLLDKSTDNAPDKQLEEIPAQ